jgi:hypothetical protein
MATVIERRKELEGERGYQNRLGLPLFNLDVGGGVDLGGSKMELGLFRAEDIYARERVAACLGAIEATLSVARGRVEVEDTLGGPSEPKCQAVHIRGRVENE